MGRVVVAVAMVLAACTGPHRPSLQIADGVPADVTELAQATWERFLDAVPARHDCLPDVTLATSRELPTRGWYHPPSATAELRIPHTATRLEQTLVHEFAHHLEFQCPEHAELRPAFLAAQGLPADLNWLAGKSWFHTPSELWAEAVTELVLGEGNARPGTLIRPATAEAVRAWAEGEELTHATEAP